MSETAQRFHQSTRRKALDLDWLELLTPFPKSRGCPQKEIAPRSFIIALSHIVIVLSLNYAWLTWIITYIGMVSQTSHHGDVVARCSWLPENLRRHSPKTQKSQAQKIPKMQPDKNVVKLLPLPAELAIFPIDQQSPGSKPGPSSTCSGAWRLSSNVAGDASETRDHPKVPWPQNNKSTIP